MRRATTFLISTLSRNAGVSQASKACNAVEILGSDSCNAPAAMFSSAASFGPLAHMASMQLEQQVQAVTSGLRNTGRLSLDTDAFWRNTRGQRCFSSGTNTEQGKPDQAASEGQASSGGSSTEGADASQNQASDDSSSSQTSAEELLNEIKAKEEAMTKLTGQVEKLTDALKRSLADMENLRARTSKEVDNAKKFALQGFVKALLDVVDNLERATGAVPADALADGTDAEKLRASLKGLLEGVQATESIMLKVLKQHGVERYDPLNQKFDPNLHSALFEMPDPSKEPGTVASVTKRGYTLNERVIRPAEVGVVRA